MEPQPQSGEGAIKCEGFCGHVLHSLLRHRYSLPFYVEARMVKNIIIVRYLVFFASSGDRIWTVETHSRPVSIVLSAIGTIWSVFAERSHRLSEGTDPCSTRWGQVWKKSVFFLIWWLDRANHLSRWSSMKLQVLRWLWTRNADGSKLTQSKNLEISYFWETSTAFGHYQISQSIFRKFHYRSAHGVLAP